MAGGKHRPPSPDKEARLRELHAARHANPRIAVDLGVSDTTVGAWLKHLGLASNFPSNPRAVRAPEAVAEVLRLRREGMSYAAVGRVLGLTKGQVAGVLERAGAQASSRGRPPRAGIAPPGRPGWPKDLPCLGCGTMRRATWEGDRMCGCNRNARVYDTLEHAIAARRGR